MKKKILTACAIATSVCLLFILLHWSQLLHVVELKMLDQRFRWFADPHAASQELVLITIDEHSLATYGRWPWPRDRHGYIVDYLRQAGAKGVVFDVLFSEPDKETPEWDDIFAQHVLEAGNVVLPFVLSNDKPIEGGSTLTPLDQDNRHPRLQLDADTLSGASQWTSAQFPIKPLYESASRLGFINLFADAGGTVRSVPILARVENHTYFQLGAAAASMITQPESFRMEGNQVTFAGQRLPLFDDYRLLVKWHGRVEDHIYPTYPIGAVLQSIADQQDNRPPLLSPALFKNKIIFVAATAAGLYDLRVTPMSRITPGVMIHMAVLDNLLQGDFLRPPSLLITVLSLVLMCFGTAFGYLYIDRKAIKIFTVLGLAVGFTWFGMFAFVYFDKWIEIVTPMVAWGTTCGITATVAFFTEGRERRYLRTVFDRYMASDVVDEILRQPNQIKLGGTKQEVTLFFSDVAGFTSISETLEPEILVTLLNEYLSMMTDIIMQYRGNVNKYLGDGIMAFFGAPKYEPEHATLACLAALECQRRLDALQVSWAAQGYPEISTRIGLNSGQVVLGNMGSPSRMEYTAMGDSVNLASRLEGANKYYGTKILLGSQTFDLAQHNIAAREIDALRVKGKQQPVVVYELLGKKNDLTAQQQRFVLTFSQALRCYKARDFITAQKHFETALNLDPKDEPARIYYQRSKDYGEHPPPRSWDGVYELKNK